MEGRKNGVACTIARRVIQIKNAFSRRVAVNVRTVLPVDGKNSEEHETYVVDSTTVDCKSCCCNGKVAKKSTESKVEYSPPPDIGFSLPVVIHRSPIKQTGFKCWSTPGIQNISLIRT